MTREAFAAGLRSYWLAAAKEAREERRASGEHPDAPSSVLLVRLLSAQIACDRLTRQAHAVRDLHTAAAAARMRLELDGVIDRLFSGRPHVQRP